MHKPNRPVLITVVAIIQLVAGGILLACGAFGVISAFAGTSSATITVNAGGKSTTRTYDIREEMEKETPGYKSFLMGGPAVDLTLHLAMVAGAIGLLRPQAWGWWLSLGWAGLRLVYQLVTFCYVWFVAMPAANRVVQAVPRDDGAVASGLVNGNTIYHLFWAITSVTFTLYPLVILILLLLPPFWRTFFPRGASAPLDDEEEDRGGEWHREEEEEKDRPRRARDDDEEEENPRPRRRTH